MVWQVSVGIAAAASCVVGVGMLLSLLLFLVIIWFPQLYQPRYALTKYVVIICKKITASQIIIVVVFF